jgi:hypothetical protein
VVHPVSDLQVKRVILYHSVFIAHLRAV